MELSSDQARRIAVRAQLLDAARPFSLVTMMDDLTLLQIDPTSAIAPSVDLVAWSRLGEGYDHSDLTFALETEHSLVEHSSFIRPMDDIGLVLATASDRDHETARDWVAANAAFRADVLARLRTDGPLISTEIEDTAAVPWASTGWTNDKNVVRMLDLLIRYGEVAVAGRRARLRTYDLAERVYPPILVVPPYAEAREALDVRHLASSGIIRPPRGFSRIGAPVTIAGHDGTWLVDEVALEHVEDAFESRTALLSPFDRLVYDRDRALELWGFEYVLEMYKPAASRRWGYFALPILHGADLVGKLDAKADRKKGTLTINAIHADGIWTPGIADAVDAEIEALAAWLGVEVVGH
jgi:uncharacterized protein YcaQ